MEPLRAGDPERVGPYRLLARLGAGGMGVVYLGRSRGGRRVAVKIIRTGLAGEANYRARFRREVGAARKVAGTFTAPVLDADPDAAEPWLATAFLPGLTLWEAIGSYGPMPPNAVRALGAGLAEALAAVHRTGVVHRDLKPGNVMLTAGGPRVIDFGIARPEDGTAITRAGTPIGTPGFMAPEQVAGEEVGPASDVFTLGAVLAYAASGTEPFGQGPTRSRLYRVMNVQADLDGLGDERLRELVEDCLRPDPARRLSPGGVLERLRDADAPSLHGTGWLPAPVAQEIGRRTAETRRTPAPRPVPQEAEADAAAGAGVEVMDLATVDPPETDPPREADPARETGPPREQRPGRRRVIAGIGAGVLASGGVGAVLLERALGPARPEANGTGKASSAGASSKTGASPEAGPPPKAAARWRVKVGDYYPDLYGAGGVLVVMVDDEKVRALDPRTGEVLWKRAANPFSRVVGDLAYLLSPRHLSLTAVRARSGDTLWRRGLEFGQMPTTGPAVTAGVACYGYQEATEILALDAGSGRTRWTGKAPADNGIAAGGGIVVAAGAKVVGLDAADGRRKWSYTMDAGRYPKFGHGLFFIPDEHGTLHAIRADDGKRAWRRPAAGYGFPLQVGGDGILYTDGGGGDVLALRAATGEVVWSRRLGNGEGANYGRGNTLGLYGGTLYVGCTDRNVYALNAADGRVLWSYGADMTLKSAPVGIGGLAFTGTRDGYVHALAPPNGAPNGAPTRRRGTHAAP